MVGGLQYLFHTHQLMLCFHSCEHYHSKGTTDRLINFDVRSGLYDTNYLEALFLGDDKEVH